MKSRCFEGHWARGWWHKRVVITVSTSVIHVIHGLILIYQTDEKLSWPTKWTVYPLNSYVSTKDKAQVRETLLDKERHPNHWGMPPNGGLSQGQFVPIKTGSHELINTDAHQFLGNFGMQLAETSMNVWFSSLFVPPHFRCCGAAFWLCCTTAMLKMTGTAKPPFLSTYSVLSLIYCNHYNSLVGGQFRIYPVTCTTAYCLPSLEGPRVLRWRARMGWEGDDIGSTATSPSRIRMIKPRLEPIHSLMFAASTRKTQPIAITISLTVILPCLQMHRTDRH